MRPRATKRPGPGLSAAYSILIALLLLTTQACQTRTDSDAESQRPAERSDEELYLYRTDEQGVIGGDCSAVVREVWAIPDPAPVDLPTAAIREVLQGVGPSRRLHAPGTKPLLEYFGRVRVENGTAILTFERDALEYLDNAACAQAGVKSPLIRTLLDFPNISAVEFEIEGEIYRDWDA